MALDNSFILLIAERLAVHTSVVKTYIEEIILDIHERVLKEEEVPFGSLGVFYKKQDGSLGFKPTAETLNDINFRYYQLEPKQKYQPNREEVVQDLVSPVLLIDEEFKVKPLKSPVDLETSELTHIQHIEPNKFVEPSPSSSVEQRNRIDYTRISQSKKQYRRKKVVFFLFTLLMSLLSLFGLVYEGYIKYVLDTPIAKSYLINLDKDSSLITLALVSERTRQATKLVPNGIETKETLSSDTLMLNKRLTKDLYGFRGKYDTTLTGYYTIISKSFFDVNSAEQGYQSGLTYGYRIRKVKVLVTNRTVWQLHIGQFQQRDSAINALDSLLNAFRSFNIVRVD
jgi:nucleoid DNA-binding protein